MDGSTPAPIGDEFFSGESPYGDDFNIAEIERWYREEEEGYFDLVQSYARYEYAYELLNTHNAYRFLAGRTFFTCMAFGCGPGDDVKPLTDQVTKFIAIEPAEQWWRTQIGGTPAEYLKPSILGDIPLDDETIDLAVCLGVLHHIPNVSYILGEISRVMAPGGLFILREPICSMGDPRKPRLGLTKNERGLPPDWLREKLEQVGFRICRQRYCMFAPLMMLARKLKLNAPFDSRTIVHVDQLLSWATKWNQHYHRDNLLKKIAPTDVFYLLEKR